MRQTTILATLLLLALASCTGAKARQNVLWPQVTRTWPTVKKDVDRGAKTGSVLAAVTASEQLDDAVRADDYKRLKGIDVGALEAAAAKGVAARIKAKEISPGVGESFRERNSKFAEAIKELTR